MLGNCKYEDDCRRLHRTKKQIEGKKYTWFYHNELNVKVGQIITNTPLKKSIFSSLPNLTKAISMEISPAESEAIILLKSKNAELERKIDSLNEMYLEALGTVRLKILESNVQIIFKKSLSDMLNRCDNKCHPEIRWRTGLENLE